MNNPPLSQDQILSFCKGLGGFSLLSSHAYYDNYSVKINKLLNKGLIRMCKRLGADGEVYEAVL